MKEVIIIGAGPAGLTAGYLLSKSQQWKVTVIEGQPEVGGMCKTLQLWGQSVDMGPHRFFSDDKRVNELWLELADGDYQMVQRLTRIYYRKHYFQYPLQPFDALRQLGLLEAARCVLSYLHQRLHPMADNGDFESWVVRRFGRRLFDIFFKEYSEKLWGIPCAELDADFAIQRIKKLSLWEAIKKALWSGDSKEHKTLVDVFAYPTGGTGVIYQKMAKAIENQGGTIHLQQRVERLILRENKVIGVRLQDGRSLYADEVISSMPLTQLVQQLPNVSIALQGHAKSLRFRNTLLVYLEVEGHGFFPDNWLYIQDGGFQTGRITNFRNWVPELYGASSNTILSLELWCNEEDDIWRKPDEVLIALGVSELKKTQLIKQPKVLNAHVLRVPRCYPVYRKDYKQHLQPMIDYLRTIEGLQLVGRYGAFKYNNQDHSILMGILGAENLLANTNHDLWAVNTDYEYQEKALIDATGLVLRPSTI